MAGKQHPDAGRRVEDPAADVRDQTVERRQARRTVEILQLDDQSCDRLGVIGRAGPIETGIGAPLMRSTIARRRTAGRRLGLVVKTRPCVVTSFVDVIPSFCRMRADGSFDATPITCGSRSAVSAWCSAAFAASVA